MKQFDFLVLLIGSIACFSCSDDISGQSENPVGMLNLPC